MRVKDIKYISDYKLRILFSDNKAKVVDLADMVKKAKGIFAPLRDQEYFQKVALDDCQLSICWPNGADICPDMLYDMGKDVKVAKKSVPCTRRKISSASHPEKPQSRVAAKSKI